MKLKILIYKLYIKRNFAINKFRIKKLRFFGASIGAKTISYGRFTVINIPNLVIGQNSTINEGVHINCRDKVIIGNNVHLSSNVQIHTGKLVIDRFPRYHDKAPIVIEDDVWIASNVTILSGVSIGKKSIIAAGSIITKNIPENSLVMGTPGKVVKTI